MSYSAQKYEALRRLGVQQLSTLYEPSYHHHHHGLHHTERRNSSPRNSFDVDEPRYPFAMNLPIRDRPVPGRKCPNCLARGQTYWVAYGKRCAQCGTEIN
ncbi:uncharacterized protein RCC_08554 [Ramularia collo-cygni]|uniref:Uncharacterized protein n=1 Tax=Ramularia collo-cygni TaxID=112498 RepID=A0A2D3VMK7_9PEZI|nr:uncharacterized protein RCC_08554 [Ramularia collo-cygni]CZT22848.1 uncharacterized protein RCC_08554 [Ramularia collo-cygni]